MKQQLFLSALVCLLVLCCCKKEHDKSNLQADPVTTEKGTPAGEVHNYTISPDGSSITSDDGSITLTFPAGAVSAPTTVGIQAISNNVPMGVGTAFRLTPEGTTFSQPVKLAFNYANMPLNSIVPEFLWVTTQNTDGTWSAIHSSEVNTTNKTVTVTTTHFSDWALGRFLDLSLEPAATTLKVGKSLQLHVSGFLKDKYGDDEDLQPLAPVGFELTPLDEETAMLDKTTLYQDLKISTWALNGTTAPTSGSAGSLDKNGSYTAPASIPAQNPVAVSVNVDATKKTGGSVKFMLVSNITIIDAEYWMRLTVDDVTHYYPGVVAGEVPADPTDYWYAGCQLSDDKRYITLLSGHLSEKNPNVLGTLRAIIDYPKVGTRQFVCYWDDTNTNDKVEYTEEASMPFYKSLGFERTGSGTNCYAKDICTSIALTITKYDDVVEGSFTGTIFGDTDANRKNCQSSDKHTIHAEFKLKIY